MTAEAGSLRFYVDESALGLGKTLTAARKDTVHTGHPLIPDCPLGVPDTEWIPAVAERGLIVIARDKRIRSRPEEVRRLREAGLRVFWIGGKKDLSTWDWLVRVVRHWDRIERLVRERDRGPWFYALNEGAVRELDV